MSTDRVIGPGEMKERGRINRLRPRESDFAGRPGYRRTYRSDGTYTWRYRFRPNEGGKLTREGAEVCERMKPFIHADTERQSKVPPTPKALLRDKDGGIRHIDPALADDTARQRGWTHAWRVGGCRVERGVDGELWRELPGGEREPTGRWCLTTPQPWAEVPEGGNPDGSMRL